MPVNTNSAIITDSTPTSNSEISLSVSSTDLPESLMFFFARSTTFYESIAIMMLMISWNKNTTPRMIK